MLSWGAEMDAVLRFAERGWGRGRACDCAADRPNLLSCRLTNLRSLYHFIGASPWSHSRAVRHAGTILSTVQDSQAESVIRSLSKDQQG